MVARQGREANGRIQAVAEFRREQLLDRFLVLAFALAAAETDGVLGGVAGAGIGGHDQDNIAEVDLLAVMVGELAVIHHLQQDVEQVAMGLFDFVQQQHAMGMLIDAIGQKPALIEADIAGRRADQARHRVAFHVFAHVEAQEFHAHDRGQLFGDFGLADTGRA